jgi:RNA polymerase sigma-70 factor, ECF subfamily
MFVLAGEVRLFRRPATRDAGAEVDRLYRRHADEVLRYALLVLRSRPDAEDIVQATFVRAFRAIERGERVRAPRNWLIKIAHNECRRFLKTRKQHVELPDEIAYEPIQAGRAEELQRALSVLAPAQRQALVLRELEGRTYAEIAGTLGVSVSAVETLIFRARRALREQIENAISCEEFAAQLDSPDADRALLRTHTRVCPACATLDRQARGRKSALKRIASTFGFPWAFKTAAVALTVSAVAVAVPHHATPVRDVPLLRVDKPASLNLVRPSRTRFTSFAPAQRVARAHRAAPAPARRSAATPNLIRRSRTRFARAALAAATPAAAPAPAPEQPAAATPPPAAPTPPPVVPAPAVPDPTAAPTPVATPALPQIPQFDPPPVAAPPLPVAVPAVTIPAVPVATPKVSLP